MRVEFMVNFFILGVQVILVRLNKEYVQIIMRRGEIVSIRDVNCQEMILYSNLVTNLYK